ncbi:MAG: hypothetical protein SNH94_03405 [Rikenellaceae bacterium]
MKHLKILLLLLVCSLPQIEAQTNSNAVEGITEDLYPYWPAYNFSNDIHSIQPAKWIEQNHTIEGWDFSLPDNITPSQRATLTTLRTNALSPKNVKPADKSSFPLSQTCEMWVYWREIEPAEGTYKWDELKSSITDLQSKGYNVLLRILTSGHTRNGKRELGYAPLWMENYQIEEMTFEKKSGQLGVECYYPGDPEFHSRYLKLVRSLGQSGIPDMVQGAYVGYGYRSHGEERIGPMNVSADSVEHVIERLDAWAEAFKGQTHKVYMGGHSQHGFNRGFGIRRGFVEMYWYTIPDAAIGQKIDSEGYLYVDESAHVVANNTFNYEINEEYNPSWATEAYAYRFGKSTASFPYRYFMSALRTLQMRCSATLISGNLLPEMVPFIAQELGRTIDDTPDIWSFMCQTTLRAEMFKNANFDGEKPTFHRELTQKDFKEGIEAKHFERWLYQRDKEGYRTEPAIKIPHAIKMHHILEGKNYDYIARRGAKIGFYADDRFDEHKGKKAIKITYFDQKAGQMTLKYRDRKGIVKIASITLLGDDKLKTATLIIDEVSLTSTPDSFDFTLEAQGGASDICVSMVRIVKL